MATIFGLTATRRPFVGIVTGALALRLAMVWLALRRGVSFTADGSYYHRLATRLAAGEGYTWLWPDGAVTAAAHYPVGYPALLSVAYAIFGAVPAVAMVVNAVFGTLLVVAIYAIARATTSRRTALVAAALVACHPGLIAYTPALMSEGAAAALALGATAASLSGRGRLAVRSLVVAALAAGAILVRPQLLLLAPVWGYVLFRRSHLRLLGKGPTWTGALGAALLTALSLVLVAPWTLRNCREMKSCALVSVNGGWNLLIGTDPNGRGGWAELKVPPDCRDVFDEAGKDACFAAAARRRIRAKPGEWLKLVPAKLAMTFDYCGAGGWYLHAASPAGFDEAFKFRLGVVETAYERLLALLAALGLWFGVSALATRRRRALQVVIGLSAVAFLTRAAWLGFVGLSVALLFSACARTGVGSSRRSPLLIVSSAMIASLALVHGVFFGAGRYQLPLLPFMGLLAAVGVLELMKTWRLRRANRPPAT